MVLKLLAKTFLFATIILSLSYALLYLNSNYDIEYVAGIRGKMKKLKGTKGKKIVIVGGSNASFGINTVEMERQLGRAVINVALHGGLSTKYMMEQAKPYMKQGDILIMSREQDALAGDHRWNYMVGTEVSLMPTYDFSELRVLLTDRNLFESSITSFFNTVKLYVRWHPFERRKEIGSVYDSRVFEGDNILPEYMNGTYKDTLMVHRLNRPNPKSLLIKGLKAYKEEFDERGIGFYMTPAVVAEGHYKEEEIMPFWSYVSEHTGIPLINDKKTYVYKKKYFLNSPHHTNLKGRELRTKSLIHDILDKNLLDSHLDKVLQEKD